MNSKKGILPKLAVMGIRKNGSTYLPYIGISIFAIFTYFVFDLILNNEVVMTVPHAIYALTLMKVGFVLLSIIMIPFLYYTNSFLIKRRKKELGLYSILGMEKKHIGVMMLLETFLIYVVVLLSAIVLGLLFSKLIFLVLLNLAQLPVKATFSFSWTAVKDTAIFYAVISGINLFSNLIAVGKANPVELMSDSKKGEKELKHIAIWTILGLFLTGWGYWVALKAQLNSMIFTDFFLAVLLVVLGTHFLFTSGSISLLKGLKKNKGFYYREENFVTVSGMLYRMKKSAASLVNICIFATMVIITVICTVSLYLGLPGMTHFVYPFDIEVNFKDTDFIEKEAWRQQIEQLASENGVLIEDYQAYPYFRLSTYKQGNTFLSKASLPEGQYIDFSDTYEMRLMTLEAWNTLEGTSFSLNAEEVLLYNNGKDYNMDQILIGDQEFRVQEEIRQSKVAPKAEGNTFGGMYVLVVKDMEVLSQLALANGYDIAQEMGYRVELNLSGEAQQISLMANNLEQLSEGMQGFGSFRYYEADRQDMRSIYGGLLFIGIFFGLIFFLCLLIIMYYKQITEGFEDQKNFDIMQKVGMSDPEVQRAIGKQVLLVFFIPLIGALLHTAIGMNLVISLLRSINLYQTKLIILCALGVCGVFTLIYILCYHKTARTYYRIVKKMA